MTIVGGSYIRKDGKLTRVGGTEEPAAADTAPGGDTSPPQAETDGASVSADPGDRSTKPSRKGA